MLSLPCSHEQSVTFYLIFITPWIFIRFMANLELLIHPYTLLLCAKIHGNRGTCLLLRTVFAKCVKRNQSSRIPPWFKKNTETKQQNFERPYFANGWCKFLCSLHGKA